MVGRKKVTYVACCLGKIIFQGTKDELVQQTGLSFKEIDTKIHYWYHIKSCFWQLKTLNVYVMTLEDYNYFKYDLKVWGEEK